MRAHQRSLAFDERPSPEQELQAVGKSSLVEVAHGHHAASVGKRTLTEPQHAPWFELALEGLHAQARRVAAALDCDDPARAAALATAWSTALERARRRASSTPGGTARLAAHEAALAPLLARLRARHARHLDTTEAIARRGVCGVGGPLPHLASIQASFGAHDVTRVRAHTDEPAQHAARRLGARGYAVGDDLAFAEAPDLFTAAHEAAHAIQQRAGIETADERWEQHADEVARAVVAGASAEPLLTQLGGGAGARTTVQRRDTNRPVGDADFGEPSREVHRLACVLPPAGVWLRKSPLPKAAATHPSAVPQNTRIWITRSTLHASAAKRWCYVAAPELGLTGFVQERHLLLDPPEPQARVHRVAKGETMHQIATRAYGKSFAEGNDARLYVQGLYEANRDRPAVKLTPVSLPRRDTLHRKEAEEETLRVYRGVQVVEGEALWVPSEAFIQRLKEDGAITSGSSELSKAWRTARDAVLDIVDAIKYMAGFVVGFLEGAWNAIVDLFKGAAEVVEGVASILLTLVRQGPGAVKALLETWADKVGTLVGKRGEIASTFVKKWTANNAWDRGTFQGGILGWLFMTVLIVVVTMGEAAPAAVAAIVGRFPEFVALLRAFDALGDVTRYLGGATRAAGLATGLPPGTLTFIAARTGKRTEKLADTAADKADKARPKAEGGAVMGRDVYRDHTYTKAGVEGISRLKQEKIAAALKRISTTRKLIHEAELIVEQVTDHGARLKVTARLPGRRVEMNVELKVTDTLGGTTPHGAETGPARLVVDEHKGVWKAEIQVSSALRPEDLDFVVRHELDEAVEIAKRHPTKPKEGFDAEHRASALAPGASPTAKATAHDIAAARELAELHRNLGELTKAENIAHRTAVLERALRAHGFDELGQLGRKLEVLKEAEATDLIRFLKDREGGQLIRNMSSAPAAGFTTDTVAHIMHVRPSNNFAETGLSGGHHTAELLRYVDAHTRFALRQVSTRNTGGIVMRHFEQYEWIGAGPKPMRGSGEAPGEPHFVLRSWTRAERPKTTFDDPHSFLEAARRAWATWSATPPAGLNRRVMYRMTDPISGIQFAARIHETPLSLTSIFPDASWL